MDIEQVRDKFQTALNSDEKKVVAEKKEYTKTKLFVLTILICTLAYFAFDYYNSEVKTNNKIKVEQLESLDEYEDDPLFQKF